jgi:hypothetical protein
MCLAEEGVIVDSVVLDVGGPALPDVCGLVSIEQAIDLVVLFLLWEWIILWVSLCFE